MYRTGSFSHTVFFPILSWMIHQSWRASPGSASAARPICTWRFVLVTVPSFSGVGADDDDDIGVFAGKMTA